MCVCVCAQERDSFFTVQVKLLMYNMVVTLSFIYLSAGWHFKGYSMVTSLSSFSCCSHFFFHFPSWHLHLMCSFSLFQNPPLLSTQPPQLWPIKKKSPDLREHQVSGRWISQSGHFITWIFNYNKFAKVLSGTAGVLSMHQALLIIAINKHYHLHCSVQYLIWAWQWGMSSSLLLSRVRMFVFECILTHVWVFWMIKCAVAHNSISWITDHTLFDMQCTS